MGMIGLQRLIKLQALFAALSLGYLFVSAARHCHGVQQRPYSLMMSISTIAARANDGMEACSSG
jgi:hypothetical protein